MTNEQRSQLRDLFEGCCPADIALEIIGNTDDDARACWQHWSDQMDQYGSYRYDGLTEDEVAQVLAGLEAALTG